MSTTHDPRDPYTPWINVITLWLRIVGTMVLVAVGLTTLVATCGCCEVAAPLPDAMEPQRGCHVVCAWEDDDPLNLPAGRCPGATPEACILECESGFADGNFCPAP